MKVLIRDRGLLFELLLLAVLIAASAVVSRSFFRVADAAPKAEEFNYLVGRGMRDVTGPPVGVQMFGFVRPDQISEGIHIRLRSRAFVVAEMEGESRVAFASVDIGSITHELQREVVDHLQKKYKGLYRIDNVIISATHTHGGPGGFWHFGADTPVGQAFHKDWFDALAVGIADSIAAAHEDLEPGKILIGNKDVENAGVNRSMTAYENNPADERAKYEHAVDKNMTLLKFVDSSGPIAQFNWFAVHETSMTFANRLITGDNKGYASLAFEQDMGVDYSDENPFVAGFASTNAGDVSPNLNLNNTGPTDDEFENTRIIGGRQVDTAKDIFESASEQLDGPISTRFAYLDLYDYDVDEEFTGQGPQKTAPSAYGYAFAAGSTEDGGGHPMFREGMNKSVPMIDNLVNQFSPIPPPSDEVRAAHAPKAILFAPGASDPPLQPQVHPIGLVQIGGLALIIGPAEFTTMAGRRVRDSVKKAMGDSIDHVVIAGYANDYAGYITTYEEYQTQQYEGGHTLHGPWTLAAYQQAYVRLAESLVSGDPFESGDAPKDLRGKVESKPLGIPHDLPPDGTEYGAPAGDSKIESTPGGQVEVAFWSGNPSNDFRTGNNYVNIERKNGDTWETVATDSAWETKIRWERTDKASAEDGPRGQAPGAKLKPGGASPIPTPAPPPEPGTYRAVIVWDVPEDVEPGTYRVVHFGSEKSESGDIKKFESPSESFEVK